VHITYANVFNVYVAIQAIFRTFETYYAKLPGVNPLASDIDNPNVP